MSFSLDVGKSVKGMEREMANESKAIVIALFRSVIKDTPVLEGRLRGNWIISADNPATGTVNVGATDTGSESKDRKDSTRGPITSGAVNNVVNFAATVDFTKNFDIYLSNNLPYASFIEFGGSKVKSPEGMVRKNLIRVGSLIAKR